MYSVKLTLRRAAPALIRLACCEVARTWNRFDFGKSSGVGCCIWSTIDCTPVVRIVGDDLDGFKLLELARLDVHFIQENAPGFLSHAAQHSVADGARLLKNLLEHKVLVAALFGLDGIPENPPNVALD